MFKKICPSLVTLEQRGTDVALYSVLIYQNYAKNRKGGILTLLNWLFRKDVSWRMSDLSSLVFIAWTFPSFKAFVQGTYSISPWKLSFTMVKSQKNNEFLLNLLIVVCTCVELLKAVCISWGLNMIQYLCPNGMTWHLFSKVVFLSHLCTLR